MAKLIALITTFFLSQATLAQSGQVPKHYVPIREVSGDLDKDRINEKVVVYNISDKEDEIEGVDREVIIFKRKKEKWVIWHRSLHAVGNSRDGGMMGDPFEEIEIKNGILLISESGGSSWKWGHTDKYRYQNKQFELIGYTSHVGKPCEYWQTFDYNVITGRISVKKEHESCNDDESQVIYKTENENFNHKLQKKITLTNRKKEEVKIVTPRYKLDLYL